MFKSEIETEIWNKKNVTNWYRIAKKILRKICWRNRRFPDNAEVLAYDCCNTIRIEKIATQHLSWK